MPATTRLAPRATALGLALLITLSLLGALDALATQQHAGAEFAAAQAAACTAAARGLEAPRS